MCVLECFQLLLVVLDQLDVALDLFVQLVALLLKLSLQFLYPRLILSDLVLRVPTNTT